MQKQDYNGALTDVRELLKVEPNNQEYILAEADINSALGDDKSALDAYQRAVAQNPANGNLYYKIAALQAKAGNTNGQVSAAEEAIKAQYSVSRRCIFSCCGWLLKTEEI